MGRQAPAGLLGIHTNLPAALPPEISAALAGGGPAPAGLSEQERASFEILMPYAVRGVLAPNFARLHVQIRGANLRTLQSGSS
jgi:hypothetical protein